MFSFILMTGLLYTASTLDIIIKVCCTLDLKKIRYKMLDRDTQSTIFPYMTIKYYVSFEVIRVR